MKFTIFSLAAAVIAVASAAPVVEKRAGDNKLVVGYWVPWGKVPVEQVDMTKYTHINYGFAVLYKGAGNPTTITIDRYYDGTPMRALVARGNQYGVPILMSIGGWTGSQTFSTVAADAGLRKTFINNALVFVRKNTLPEYHEKPDGWSMDGLDIDWEYPGRPAAACNTYSPQDSANYLILLKELRAALDAEFPTKRKLLTAAVRVQPFDGADGKPLKDVSAYAQYFDWIAIMAYDIMGSWSATTGPNAPFNTPAPPGDPFSFRQSIEAWRSAGWPADKLVMGTAFYGRSVTTTVDMNTQNPISMYVNKTNVTPKGGPSDTNDVNFYCNEGSVYSGMWKWKELRGAALSTPTTAINGWVRRWDAETQTPWLFRASDKTFVSYDDIDSLTIKVNHVNQQGLRGVMLWDISYDYNSELLDVLQKVHCTNCPVITTTGYTTIVPTTTVDTGIPSSTSTVVATTTAGTGLCAGVAPWNSATVYAAPGTKVTYNGRLYTNNWWTQGEAPSGSAWGVWKDVGAC
ncbi:hypothetical protein BX616_002206 [Lobosporangium transversale]|uniref:Glycosyl hydrolases family 18-domain-containing protein n=1 Tax=Lobosporangium transversale TaxID=64571 RepID=A0A1Y2GQS2_9FUNG|nr:glycosyl hydrolases family 18-domain-containing protein [Lobosporangium transversale]KAF9901603.1 hypothetical protein BX616_002206 [Lobosporangium transversale]ORZ19246.1 glycosyl hydrolases family 18-domain-containing protein [Lobosporangium transversale]|eukprot:XP_021882414.1 glycosyl hydrolases family 18-domain-containing protein [Lobosporangium transversale]